MPETETERRLRDIREHRPLARLAMPADNRTTIEVVQAVEEAHARLARRMDVVAFRLEEIARSFELPRRLTREG